MTPKQLYVFEFIKNKIGDDGVSPTYNEIQNYCELSSISQAYKVVDSLIKKGYIEKEGHGNRQLIIKQTTDHF
jgi:SOS-response transcriptional repressor LexA|tara:strand:- start:624 stop:842 length:219 start_codon:yes stop_codon:yes gene_type:complete